jgi:hypothetical protein
MVRSAHGTRSADFVKEQGWRVGDRIVGGPIMGGPNKDRVVEAGLTIVITAIGEEMVLTKTVKREPSPYGYRDREMPMTFTERDWEKIEPFSIEKAIQELNRHGRNSLTGRAIDLLTDVLLVHTTTEERKEPIWPK